MRSLHRECPSETHRSRSSQTRSSQLRGHSHCIYTPIWTSPAELVHGFRLSVKQLYREIGETSAPPEVAEAFGISPGTLVMVRRRTTIVDGRPHQLADSYYPLDLAKGTLLMEESSGPGGGFARL